MPLRQTRYGRECLLGKFEIDISAGGGCYTSDPLEACAGNPEIGKAGCNFADLSGDGFDLEKVCQCPVNMTLEEHNALRKQYASQEDEKTKTGFWEFVKKSRNSIPNS